MKLSKGQMVDLLKEEYEKRINHYLNLSEIETKDKNDNDLVISAQGLKLKDKAGFLYTIIKIFKDTAGNAMVRLAAPGSGVLNQFTMPSSTTPIYETESEDSGNESKKLKSGSKPEKEKTNVSPEIRDDIIPKNKDMDYKRSFVPDMDNPPATETLGLDGQGEEYIDMPIDKLKDFTL